jgi:hypothetical protein
VDGIARPARGDGVITVPRLLALGQLPQGAIAAGAAGSRLSLGRSRQRPRRNRARRSSSRGTPTARCR